MCVYVCMQVCMYEVVCTTLVQVTSEARREHHNFCVGICTGLLLPMWVFKLNLCPLQEYQALLDTELLLQSLQYICISKVQWVTRSTNFYHQVCQIFRMSLLRLCAAVCQCGCVAAWFYDASANYVVANWAEFT